jgi:hypothetical protein
MMVYSAVVSSCIISWLFLLTSQRECQPLSIASKWHIIYLFVPFLGHVEKAEPLSAEAIDVQYNYWYYNAKHTDGRT